MIITIQNKTFNSEAITTIYDNSYYDDGFIDDVVSCATIKFGFLNTLDFPGYTVEELKKEINKQIKKNK